MAPWAAFALIKAMGMAGVALESAVPVGFTVAIVGVKWLEDRLTAWLDKKLPRL